MDSSHRRANQLLRCLEATKSCLNFFLQIPPALSTRHSTQERGSLVHAISVLIKIAFCSDTGLDNFSLREACNVTYYIDALAGHIGGTCANDSDDDNPDSCSAIKAMAERVKDWYERTEFFEQAGTPSDLTNMSPMQFVKIAKEEPFITFDFNNIDFSFLDMPQF